MGLWGSILNIQPNTECCKHTSFARKTELLFFLLGDPGLYWAGVLLGEVKCWKRYIWFNPFTLKQKAKRLANCLCSWVNQMQSLDSAKFPSYYVQNSILHTDRQGLEKASVKQAKIGKPCKSGRKDYITYTVNCVAITLLLEMSLQLWCWRDSWGSLGRQGDQTSQS